MNRTAIRNEIRRLANDLNSIRYTDAMLNSWIDLGVDDMMAKLSLDTAMATISTTGSDTYASSEPNYQLPSNAFNLREVYYNDVGGQDRRLHVLDQDELNSEYGQDWRTQNPAVPWVAYRADYNVLGIHPRPNAANNARTLRVYYDRMASALASDTDAPIFMTAFHDAITFFCLDRCYLLLSDVARADYARKRYEKMCLEFRHKQLGFSKDLTGWRWG